VLKQNEEYGVTRAELVHAYGQQKACKGTQHAHEWLQIVVRETRNEAHHLEFLYSAYRPNFYWYVA
jgi:hypothetical protein